MRSVSMRPSATHESGHSYFAQTGHSHFAATLVANSLCREQEKRTMPDTEGSFGNSGQTPRSALMRKKTAFLLLAFAVSAASLVAQTRTARTTLDIYVVDV